ncbi:penicillin-binding transpeptidase domain-containing protein [Dysgonomonas sp. ZJ279]|uniref:penicillin-binding transpeptidase domain-containing protein n=1 Tax=Dysgonomonas sp. ZJ279 TaxID=2709796 RepID=UPI0013ED47A7|nr:penicillin-binding transpeptidase domain-containing protein [Dysgonomonas sp. ZJ279]
MTKSNLELDKRKYILAGIVCVIVLIFIFQLFNLQIIKNEYKDYADGNAFFNKTLYPARGTISDRKNKLLVYNQPTYDIVYIPREVQQFDTLDFCSTLGITKEQFEKRISDIKDRRQNPGYSSYTMQTFMTQLSIQESGLLQEKLYKFPGFFIQNRTLRQYNYKNAGLILGYVAEVSKNQLDNDSYYVRGDYGGKSGIESSYENILRGEKGREILLRDAHGRIQGKYEDGRLDKAPVSGKNLTLSMDMDLQAYGEYLMQNKVGSIVMIEPSTGEVLCMVTSPTYDPSMLLGREFSKSYLELEQNPLKPLLNRSIQGMYPPGSTFKTTQGLIFLDEDIINTSTAYPCAHGYPPLGGRPKCHPHGSPLAIEAAIATSCNSFFCYGLTAMLHNRKKYPNIEEAFEVWKNHMVDMGFGYRLGIDLPSEKRGFIPNSKFYSRAFKTENWKAANIISIAIGQGEISTTPLQVANLAALIANRGHYYAPHIVKEIQDTPLDSIYTIPHQTTIKKEHFNTIVEGMAHAVTGGTCRGANLLPEIEVCGKTGTAENPHGKDHSIFMGFAPKNDPKVAIFVIVENAGFGATFGVPIGRLMIQKYLKGEVPESDKYIEDRVANTTILPSNFINWNRGKSTNQITIAAPVAQDVEVATEDLNINN